MREGGNGYLQKYRVHEPGLRDPAAATRAAESRRLRNHHRRGPTSTRLKNPTVFVQGVSLCVLSAGTRRVAETAIRAERH